MAVQPVQPGYHRANMSLAFKDAKAAIEFYKRAFGAELRGEIMPVKDGKGVMHAEIFIGDTPLMLSDDVMHTGKTVDAGFAAAFVPHLAVADAHATWKRAIDAGCKETMPLKQEFWGDLYGQLTDPFGLRWGVMQHVEDVSPEERKKRAAKMMDEWEAKQSKK